MLNRLLPALIDNRYRGHVLALWFFVPIAVWKVGIGLAHMFRADGGAQSVSTIPLDTYPPSAAQNVVALFARMGLEQFLLGALLVIVVLRYRALIPLMYVMLVVHYLAARIVAQIKPLALAGESGASIPTLVIAILSVAGLIASLIGRGYEEGR